jgi:transcriptional regulator with XRE-family HTH domain
VETIGDRVKRERLRNAWTQAQLAERAGITAVAISKIERGEVRPHPSTIAKLAGAFNVRPRDLVG